MLENFSSGLIINQIEPRDIVNYRVKLNLVFYLNTASLCDE